MYRFLLIFLFFSLALNAQDKLFFKNGTSKKGIIVSITKDLVYFKINDTSNVEKINKNKLVLMEDYRGNRYLFSSEQTEKDSITGIKKKKTLPRNIFSVQPLGVFFGRANFVYERLSKDNKIGFVIPLSLTFDPAFGNIYNSAIDSSLNSRSVEGLSFITGLDVNFYVGKGEFVKFFIGPRFRYGTDVAFFNIEAYTLQTQLGWKISRPEKKMVQHLSLGFGFANVISSPILNTGTAKQSHLWYSLNYRLGLKW